MNFILKRTKGHFKKWYFLKSQNQEEKPHGTDGKPIFLIYLNNKNNAKLIPHWILKKTKGDEDRLAIEGMRNKSS